MIKLRKYTKRYRDFNIPGASYRNYRKCRILGRRDPSYMLEYYSKLHYQYYHKLDGYKKQIYESFETKRIKFLS